MAGVMNALVPCRRDERHGEVDGFRGGGLARGEGEQSNMSDSCASTPPPPPPPPLNGDYANVIINC